MTGETVETWHRDGYTISTDPARLDIAYIHHFLMCSYWAAGIPLDIVERSIQHSLPFGLFDGERQIGFARVVTDRATFAYLADVFVDEAYRGRSLSKWLLETILAHPDLQLVRSVLLATADAHDLYRRYGFGELPEGRYLIRRATPGLYERLAQERDAQR